MLSLCLTLWKAAKLFPKVAVPFCIPNSNALKFQLLYILTYTWYTLLGGGHGCLFCFSVILIVEK